MNNNFKQLLERFSQEWKSCFESTNLQEVEETFSKREETHADIMHWIVYNIDNVEDHEPYLTAFWNLEEELAEEMGMAPIFDESFDIYESFDEYETYYQRYGCMLPEFVISWDDKQILWSDDETIDYIQRPDVLMGGND